MIPKKIHFCWLSGDEYPPLIKHCIETWRKVLPDYEIVLWDTKRFDVNSVQWVKDAFEARKYAFAADYIRLYAVFTEGGIYLDSDVEVLKPFDDLLKYKTFIGFEAATQSIEAAIFGAEAGCEWCAKAMEFYKDKHFVVDGRGGVDLGITAPNVVRHALDGIYRCFPKQSPKEPLRLYYDGGDMLVCPAEYFSPIKYDMEKSYATQNSIAKSYRQNPKTYCIHRFNASWGLKPPLKIQLWDMIKKKCERILGERVFNRMLKLLRHLMR